MFINKIVPGRVYFRWLRIQMLSWTQRSEARDSKGNSTLFNSKDAVEWCPIGAIKKLPIVMQYDMRKILESYIGRVEWWNDHSSRTQEQIRYVISEIINSNKY